MSDRNYINLGISDLEGLVEQHEFDGQVLEDIRVELGHRKKNRRNVSLLKEIDSALSYLSDENIKIDFPVGWLSEDGLEDSLKGLDFLNAKYVRFVIPVGCKIMVNAAVKMLTLVNQLAENGKALTLDFEEKLRGTQGYLKRVCFFEHLDGRVTVVPTIADQRSEYFGGNESLVEIISITREKPCVDVLPGRLASALIKCAYKEKISGIETGNQKLTTVVTTLFSELLDNVREHSGSKLHCFAACQIYSTGIAQVVVSDSGVGILNTLRPSLQFNYPDNSEYLTLSDQDLVLEMFKTGISSRSSDGGGGLPTCAAQATKFDALVTVRICDMIIRIRPSMSGHRIEAVQRGAQLAAIHGTTISFEFPLANLTD